MRKRILVAMGVVAIMFGVVSVAFAATTPTSVKACVNAAGSLRLVSEGSCGKKKAISLVTRDYPGVAKAYAHVIGGEVDSAYSWNITAANLYTTGNGMYCFRNLGFTPKHAQVTLDYWGPANGDIPVIMTSIPPNQNLDCGLDTLPQAFVFTGLVDPGVFTQGVQFGFYIALY